MTIGARIALITGGIVAVIAGTAVAVVLVTSGAPTACPAIGWSNDLRVLVAADGGDRVAALAICTEVGCVPTASSDASTAAAHRLPSGNWRVTVGMTTPKSITVHGLDTAGTVIARVTVHPRWERVGGSETCGGPARAGAMTLTLD